ncbi:TonB-dependent receptor [Sphingomonas sp. KR3-1]|uniref:TonB-dependent receptor n=1 Tax=Sphingomonas sp. KR3-1 TaxID=3156611 RepID=UPI0032B5C3BC
MTGFNRRAQLAAALFSTCVLASSPALAQAATRAFDIEAQPLASALTAWARQAHVQIFFPTDTIRGVRSRALKGVMTDRAALDRLLAGTGLRITSNDGHTAILARGATSAQSQPAVPVAAATQAEEGGPIVVTGFRASLQAARETKRKSDAIVDVVAAEDIGQLPDNSATEALARLPGVQIFRNRGEGQAVTVRGISQVVTTLNGQEAYTGASRRTLLNSYPSSMIGSIQVYKALTPDLIEGGIGGSVDVQLRQPLDFAKGITVAGTLRGSYDDQAKKPFYNVDLLVSGRWDTGIGEIGVLANASYLRRDYLESYRENLQRQYTTAAQSVTPAGQGTGLNYPIGILVKHVDGHYARPVLTGEVQWRPAYNLGFKLRATNIADDNRYNDNDLQTNIAAGTALRDVVLVPGTNIIKSATFTATANSGPRSSNTRQLLDTTQIEFGADWTSGIATLTTSAVYTLSRINTDQQLFLLAFNKAPVIHATFQSDSKYGGLSYTYDNVDMTDPSLFHVRAYSDSRNRAKGDGLQWRTDLTLDTGQGLIRSIKTGIRYANRTADYREGTSLADLNSQLLPMSAFPGGSDPLVIDAGFGGDDAELPSQWIGYRGSNLSDASTLLALNNYVHALPGQSALFTDNGRPAYDPLKAFHGSETSYAWYGQAKYGFGLGGIGVDGIVGARIVNTVLAIDGTQTNTARTPAGTVVTNTPIHGRQNYVDVDPSASMVFHFSRRLQLRLAYTKTFSRPDFTQLNPSMNLAQVTAASGAYVAAATTGNPDLQPIRSTNWDASLEYYYGRAGAFSIALFERDVNGFIVSTKIDETSIPSASGTVTVTKPINAGDGRIRGVEFNASTFFDFAPGMLRNFGASANLTLMESRQELPATPVSVAFTGDTTGISRRSFNGSLFYDDGPFRAKVAYSIRSGFVLAYTLTDRNNDLKWYPISRLDASATYRFSRNVMVTLEGSNLLAKPQRAYWADKTVTDRVYFEGRVFSAALRFKY